MSMAMDTEKRAVEREYEAKAAEVEARVHVEHAALRETFERLENVVGRLSARLVKVLQPEQTVIPNALTPVESKPVSPLAARLQDDTTHVNRIADQISELLDRLEV